MKSGCAIDRYAIGKQTIQQEEDDRKIAERQVIDDRNIANQVIST